MIIFNDRVRACLYYKRILQTLSSWIHNVVFKGCEMPHLANAAWWASTKGKLPGGGCYAIKCRERNAQAPRLFRPEISVKAPQSRNIRVDRNTDSDRSYDWDSLTISKFLTRRGIQPRVFIFFLSIFKFEIYRNLIWYNIFNNKRLTSSHTSRCLLRTLIKYIWRLIKTFNNCIN